MTVRPMHETSSEHRTVADARRDVESRRTSGGERPGGEAAHAPAAGHVRPMLWNTGVEWFTNDTRTPGEPAGAGTNLFYLDLEWNPLLLGPGQPLGVLPRLDDQQQHANLFDGQGIILPWCSNSSEVTSKAIVVRRLADDLNTIEEPLLFLFQYYWDNVGYYLPAGFSSFDQRRSMGEGPSGMVDVTLFLDPSGRLAARASTSR